MSSGGVGGDKFGVTKNKTVISKMTKKGKVKYKKAPQAPRRFKSA
eukprot:CAMPEP_0202468720 /NCGR_PEP_ID=MMETSP1360-20130828/76162_1 /ASSEMBLY_ACC=CAM_ASM_000848 /TAXON_ID=515479 /ORGANISM="Licmophora paradoxa, Strain CCMP2313" /LENGTH=44 /DNA_ID= /DNA_START= /DNA_END= /DNA_ORIENTATION=